MKHFLLATFFGCAIFTASTAQDSLKNNRYKEFHITAYSLLTPSFQFKYKWQVAPRVFMKTGLVNLSLYSDKKSSGFTGQDTYGTAGASIGAMIGVEFRYAITERITFLHGPSLAFTYGYNRAVQDTDIPYPSDQITHEAGVGIPYTIGMLYPISDKLLIGAEFDATLGYVYSKYRGINGNTYSGFGHQVYANVNMRRVGVSLVFRL